MRRIRLLLRIRIWLRNATCRHKAVRVEAATGAELDRRPVEVGVGLNVTVGVIVRCQRCDRAWTDDVVACAPPEVYAGRAALAEASK